MSELCWTVRLSSRPDRVAKKEKKKLAVFGCWGRYLCEWEGYVAMALFLFWERWGLQWSATSYMWWIWWGEHQKSWSHQNGHVINQEMFRIMQRRHGARWKCVHYAVWDSWFIERMFHSVNAHCIFDGGKSSVCRTWRLKVAKYYTEQFEGFALDDWIPWWWGKKGHMPGVGNQKACDTSSQSQPCCITQ